MFKMRCDKCGYDWSHSGDSAHACGRVNVKPGMNKERVRELYDLARLQAGEEKNFAATVEDVYLKFADMLLQECNKALSPYLHDVISRGDACELINNHFGVE